MNLTFDVFPARVLGPNEQVFDRARVALIDGVLTIWQEGPGRRPEIVRLVEIVSYVRDPIPRRWLLTDADDGEWVVGKGNGCGCGSPLKALSLKALVHG